MNVAWAVPRNSRPNPIKARGRSLLLLGTVGLGVLGTTVLAAVGWQVLQTVGTGYVRHVQSSSAVSRGTGSGSTTNDTFALVLGLIAFLYVGALLTVIAVEINVVRAKHLYPRSLLTPFTDDVVLTQGDERAYTDAAKAQRNKGFETIHVLFRRGRKPPRSGR